MTGNFICEAQRSKFLIETYATDHDSYCDWAIVDLSVSGDRIGQYIVQAELLKKGNPNFSEVSFFDPSIIFVESTDELEDSIVDKVGDGAWKLKDELPNLTATTVETPTIHISTTGIRWTTDTKGDGVPVETKTVKWEDLTVLA